jgi:hypothetical protein
MMVNTVYEMTNGVVNQLRVLPYDPQEWDAFWS